MERFYTTSELYGRVRESSALEEAFHRTSRGRGELLLVPGASGVGKTAVVHTLRKAVRSGNGFYIEGKFDQYSQGVPLSPFRAALAALCREILCDEPQKVARYREEILRALAGQGQALIDLEPEFEALLGPQPPLSAVSPQEAAHRFASAIQNFFGVVCRPEHPLVLFIDDWQWADAASLKLLQNLQPGLCLRYFLIIVSYRDTEVDNSHPLTASIDEMRGHDVPITTIPIHNISHGDIREFLEGVLTPALDDLEELTDLLHEKTGGNPFFLHSFLGFLYERGLLFQDPEHSLWIWDKERIFREVLPESVVELFVLRLNALPPRSRELISLAACLGNQFDLEWLSIISGRPGGECAEFFTSPEARGLCQPLETSLPATEERGLPVNSTMAFLHDRIQQAAYSLIAPEEIPRVLLRTGRLLLASLAPDKLELRLFEVVSDLNAGQELIESPTERATLLTLNIEAGRKAFAATAYRSALEYYRSAHRLLDREAFADALWQDHHGLAMSLLLELGECEFVEGNFSAAETFVRQAAERSANKLERASALNSLVLQFTLLARYPEAIATGRLALASLGCFLPENDYEQARAEEIVQVRRGLAGRPVAALLDLPEMSDPEMLLASRILITMGPPCYRSHQLLWGVIVPRAVNLTLQYGNIPQVGYSHTAMGGLLVWVDDDFETARAFGEVAHRLMSETFSSPSDQSVYYLMNGSSLRHWFSHLRSGSQDYEAAVAIGLRAGNLQYAAYAYGHNMYCEFFQGMPLPSLIKESQHALAFSRTRMNQWAIDLLEGGIHLFEELAGATVVPDTWSDESYLHRVEVHRNIQVACTYRVLEASKFLFLGELERALAASDEAAPLIYTVGTQGLLPWPEHVFARAMILTGLYRTVPADIRSVWRIELEQVREKLRIWAENCPENFRHKFDLVSAELARLDGLAVDGARYYGDAAAGARQGGFLQWEALSHERADLFWRELGSERLAEDCWCQAYTCYTRWGALAKTRIMEAAYRDDLRRCLLQPPPSIADKANGNEIERLVEQRVGQLRKLAADLDQASLRPQDLAHAEELSRATGNLRREVAERKRIEEELREYKDLLEDRVKKRTADLEISLNDRKRAERELLELYNRAPCGYHSLDKDGLVLRMNATELDWLGYRAEEVIGKLRATELMTPASQEIFRRIYPEFMVLGVLRDLKLEYVRKDGTIMPVLIQSNAIMDRNGNYVRSNTTVYDISELEQHERERERLLSALEQSGETIVITDTQGTICYVNTTFERVSGYTREEAVGCNTRMLKSGQQDAAFYQDLWDTIQRGEVWRGRLMNRRKDGTLYTEDSVISPVRDAVGKVTNFVAVKRDISRELILEEQYHQARKMEAIGTLAGGIAHDFNNLLQVILGFTSLMEGRLGHDPRDREEISQVRGAATRGSELVRHLLSFSRQQSGQPTALDLNEVVHSALAMVQRLIGEPIEVHFHPDPQLEHVRGDRVQIEQVLMNLCFNARDAMPHGGTLLIETANVFNDDASGAHPSDTMGRPFVRIRVADTGLGMDDATRARIFEPFFTTKEVGKGTGLGLSMVYGIVKQHKGWIDVTSAPGNGTSFQILLPSIGQAEIQPKLSEVSGDTRGTESILVAEDEAGIREFLDRVLSREGYHVLTATDGEDAWRIFQENHGNFHLIVLDVMMPRLNGWEVMKRIHTERPLMPILFSSGYSEEGLATEAEPGKDYHFIKKPYDRVKLLNAVRGILDSSDGTFTIVP